MLDRVAFTLFGVWDVYWYGIFIAVGLLAGIFVMLSLAKRSGMDTDNTLDVVLLVVPLAVIGARAHYVLWSWHEFSYYGFPEILYRVVAAWDGGMAIYGGMVGGLLGIILYCRWKKVPIFTVTDWIVPALALGQAMGRWGNYVNQEVYGKIITNVDFQWFPVAVWIDKTQEWHMATFFYECVGDLAIFLLLYFFVRKQAKSRGIVTMTYFLLYGILRGCLEGLRSEEFIQTTWGLPVNQILSFVLAAAAVVGLILLLRKPLPIYDRKTALEAARLKREAEEEAEEEAPSAPAESKELGGFVIGEKEPEAQEADRLDQKSETEETESASTQGEPVREETVATDKDSAEPAKPVSDESESAGDSAEGSERDKL